MVQATVNLQVRLPEEVRRRLAEAAEANKRSLNSEVVWRLERSLVKQLEELSADTAEIVERMLSSPEFRQGLASMVSNMPNLGSGRKAKGSK
jgi:Arc-like DNA binding domain